MTANRGKVGKNFQNSEQMSHQKPTKVDRALRWWKNLPFIWVVILGCMVITGLATVTISVRFLYDQVRQIVCKTDVRISAAVYVYERGFLLEGTKKTYYYEMRNLATNCSLWRHEIKNLPRGRSETPKPYAKIILKLFLENPSKMTISNLRFGLRGLPFNFDKIICSPNIEASIKRETTSNEALSTQVIIIPSLAPAQKAIISLETPVDRRSYQQRVGIPLTISCPFLTSDQLTISRLNISKMNAMEMVKRESELFTGERTFGDEKIEGRILSPWEPSIVEEYESLPPAQKCREGTGGNW